MSSQSSKPDFPFTAVVGQDLLKLALVLAVIDPGIGGVLISGPRGSAKSTLARALAGLLPDGAERFVNLPLGAGEEMVTGTLDLQQVLDQKRVTFNPGLLSRAHRGVLYIDEVNLLADPLVDLLLDVASSGVNYVERDGVSHRHAAEFLLVGTMNPDEGELRPQLQDRFALAAYLDNQYSPEERVAIVRQRLEFDRNPETFCQRYRQSQTVLLQRLESAQRLVPRVELGAEHELAIATACQTDGVDGLRADISWNKAARAHAAWSGRSRVEHADIEAVRELVLNHRRQRPGKAQPENPPAGFPRPPGAQNQAKSKAPAGEGDWGAMAPVRLPCGELRSFIPDRNDNPPHRASSRRPFSAQRKAGRTVIGAQRRIQGETDRIHWFATLSSLSNRDLWPPSQWIFRTPRGANGTSHLVLLDTSASTLRGGLLAKAKGLVLGIARQAYLARQQLAVYSFGNQHMQCLRRLGRAPKTLRIQLDKVECGGGTPLRLGVAKLAKLSKEIHRRNPGGQTLGYIISDGRSADWIADLELAGRVFWIDTESSSVKRGKGVQLAQSIQADYCSLPV